VASLRASVHDAGVEAAKWARLVRRHESEAARAPARYRLRVGVFATLAYAAVFAWLLLLFALLLVVGYAVVARGMPDLAAVKVALVAGTPLLLTLRALAVDVPAPEGIELTREGAPELFAAIGRIDAAVRGPSLAAVVLTDDLNAGVATVPRFLSFFGSRNYLVVGLPLLQAVRPDEFDAVLAHEFAHLSRRHGRLSLAVYPGRDRPAVAGRARQEDDHDARGFPGVLRLVFAATLRLRTAARARARAACRRNRRIGRGRRHACLLARPASPR